MHDARAEIGTGQWAVMGESSGALPDVDLYTLDLNNARGSFLDIALHGQGGVSFADATLELLDPAGAVVATASPGETFDRQILEFAIPDLSAGSRYGVRVTSSLAGEYLLLVRDGQQIETDTDDNSNPRTLSDGGRAHGFLVSDQSSVVEPDDFPPGTPRTRRTSRLAPDDGGYDHPQRDPAGPWGRRLGEPGDLAPDGRRGAREARPVRPGMSRRSIAP